MRIITERLRLSIEPAPRPSEGPARATVHLVAREDSLLARTVLRAFEGDAVFRCRVQGPPRAETKTGEIVVVDLSDPAVFVTADLLRALLDHTELIIAVDAHSSFSPWISLLERSTVTVVRCKVGGSQGDFSPLVHALEQRLATPTGSVIADLVLSKERSLADLEPLVRVFCSQPWRIMRLCDLSACSGLSRSEIRRRCIQIGFSRVEHFITCVRLIAYEQLLATGVLRVAAARKRMGIRDSSNWRRQLRRARDGSVGALAKVLRASAMLVVCLLTDMTAARTLVQ